MNARDVSEQRGGRDRDLGRRWLTFTLSALFLFVLLRTAWLCDDAYISFRGSWNWVEGFGLRWNVAERVQTFTNPLWVLLVALGYRLTGELYFTVLALSGVLSTAAFVLLVRRRAVWVAALGGSILLSSKAFVDFSTSGLESPLTYLLLTLFLLAFLQREPGPRTMLRLSLLAGLLAANRLDTVLITGPVLAWVLVEGRSLATLRAACLGALPLALWIGFAWFYYGFPLPNTAHAKAFGLGIPRATLLQQGLIYFQDSIARDPVTLPLILFCLVLMLGSRKARPAVIAGGILVHLAYVLWIGGDFMSGRFFTVPLLASVASLGWLERPRSLPVGVSAVAVVTVLGLFGSAPSLLAGRDFEDEHLSESFITDERAYYFQKTGLLAERRHAWNPLGSVTPGPWKRELFVVTAAGRTGFDGGPWRHVVDDLGLCDSLVARLPARNVGAFRPGHVPRLLPEGYLPSLWTGEDRIADPDLARYCSELRLVTRGPLWSRARLAAIWRFASGKNHELLARYLRDAEPAPLQRVVPIGELRDRVPEGTAWHSRDVLLFNNGRIVVQFEQKRHETTLQLGLDANDYYHLVVGNETRALCDPIRIPAVSPDQATGIVTRTVRVPAAAAEAGYTWIAIGGLGSDGLYTLGHVAFGPP